MGCIGMRDSVFVESEKPGVDGVRVRVWLHILEVRVFNTTDQSGRSSLFGDPKSSAGGERYKCVPQ